MTRLKWDQLEAALTPLPQREVVRLAVRHAHRVTPTIAQASSDYGPETWEWLNASLASISVVEAFVNGDLVSRFSLDLAADVARGTANAAANVVRLIGPSKVAEDIELVFAAVAFSADAARSLTPQRTARFAAQSVRASETIGLSLSDWLWTDYERMVQGEVPLSLWYSQEPTWYQETMERFSSIGSLPKVLVL